MTSATASIRELRTDFRTVKLKIEQYGQVIITDNGKPAYVVKAVARKSKASRPLPNYYARLLKEQPVPLTAGQSRRLHKENRGDR